MKQQIVNLVGNDDQLVSHLLLSQRLRQLHGLVEWHIVVVIRLNHQDRRSPPLDGRQRRRCKRQAVRFGLRSSGGVDLQQPGPIVYARVVDACGKDVGGAGQRQGSHVPTVTAAPYAETLRIDIRSGFEKVRGSKNVVELARSGWSEIGRHAEAQTVAGTTAIVDG